MTVKLRFILLLLLPMKAIMAYDSANHLEHFSKGYAEARQAFLKEVWGLRKSKVLLEHQELRVSGESELALYADSLYLPAVGPKEKLLILVSGIHGAEAPLGSALQVEFLSKLFPHLERQNLGVLLIHALNPHGYHSGRRVTQNNVDLNRNFLENRESFKQVSNLAYEKHHALLSKKEKVQSYWKNALAIVLNFARIALRGSEAEQELTQAFAGGQYRDPRGIYFGGSTYEPQVEWTQKLLDQTLPQYKEVLLYDIHTGLGKASQLQMISSLETRLDSEQVLALRSRLEQKNAVSFVSPHSEGFYVTSGDFIDYVYAKAAAYSKVATFTMEFGTLGDDVFSKLKTSTRIILENQGQHFGFASKSIEDKVRKNFSELFNPSNSSWQKSVMEIGMQTLEATLEAELSKKKLQKAQ